MADPVIAADKVAKKFSRTLRASMLYGLQDLTRAFFGLAPKTEVLRPNEFWALDNISFELRRGEALGIIGANGSGKSTLLKLINGIFLPDKGTLTVRGRVGALIAVGAGFHPLLTGRENIYVNGQILGMSKKEIDEKFDAIVDFAELRDALDRPVKHYSSGMFVRLGFAVAVHCEPDILLVDEVLAVGDLAFQRRCYERLEALRRRDIAFILVTHSLNQVERLCERAILLDQGAMVGEGPPAKMAIEYTSRMASRIAAADRLETSRPRSSGELEIADVRLSSPDGEIAPNVFRPRCRLRIEIAFALREPVCANWHLGILTAALEPLWEADTFETDFSQAVPGHYQISCEIADTLLRPGDYLIKIKVRGMAGHIIQGLA
ncbi:MAG: polysaccharide ABC transporter ATP-binding protein, partial [Planctomycetota bacterium]|nr:polysaccharide ABC transporter ATP-binding protein [Planctomycetota bacterium]